ncbi:MAG: hypothetical protein V4558_16000 [Gemmatimonadota bacterium]
MHSIRIAPLLLAAAALFAPLASAQSLPALSLDHPKWVSAESFTSVSAVRELKGGEIVVADQSDVGVYLLSAVGTNRRKLGRAGAGPNEYASPSELIRLPGDSTLLLDFNARRYLIIDPVGRLVATTPFPAGAPDGLSMMRGADHEGRIYFQATGFAESPSGLVAIQRWDRRSGRVDSLAVVLVANPKPFERTVNGHTVTIRQLAPYAPVDDWAVAPSGRLALIRESPYLVEWRELDGRTVRGAAVTAVPVAVTDADKKVREPRGPPFTLNYPATKPVMRVGYAVIDPEDRVWVRRSQSATATQSEWDIFDRTGKRLGSRMIPSNMRIAAFTARTVYVVRRDSDDLEWLEGYAR